MYTLLVVAVLFALLFNIAAATSPTIDPALPAPAMESLYPGPDGMRNALCDICTISMEYCTHALRTPTFTPQTFYDHPEWKFLLAIDDDEPSLEPLVPFPPTTEADRQPLAQKVVQYLEENATTIQPSTVQVHVDDTYTPGDRSRRIKRQAPRPGGFPCTYPDCSAKPFNRCCDLNRHLKRHLSSDERPHKCAVCGGGFIYPKDLSRHQRTRHQSSSSESMIRCLVPGCSNTDGFSRRDNLLRHQRKQHPYLFVASSLSP